MKVNWAGLREFLTARSDFHRIARSLERLVELKEQELGITAPEGPPAGEVSYVDEAEMAGLEAMRTAHFLRGGAPLEDGSAPFQG